MTNQNLWQLFTTSAVNNSHKLACVAGEHTLTYEQLLEEVYAYMEFLQNEGVKPGCRIAIMLPRTEQLLIALLAIIGCGATYVPLDNHYPQFRQDAILSDSGSRFFIKGERGNSALVKHLPPPSGDKLKNLVSPVKLNSSDLAYIIYTSGSTGLPKGVMISHGNVSALLDWALSVFKPEELAYTLATTSICFDLSIFELFLPLAAGGCIVLIDNALALINNKIKYPITIINTVPSVMEVLVNSAAIPDSIKTINLAGEALQQSLVNSLYDHSRVEKVYNLYGPTETTTYSTFYLVEKNSERVAVPIGKAIADTKIYLLDESQQPVPKLARGEIYISGKGVSQGYCNREKENLERFVSLEINGESIKLYRTGDLAKLNHASELVYLGRKDEQIKIRGFRVEPGEIVSALKQQSNIEHAYVITHPEIDAGQQLIAYVVTKNKNESLDREQLVSWLSERLADYMIPNYFIQLAALPLNSNGKIDRGQLPLPGPIKTSTDELHSALESSLVEIWQTLLRKNTISREDNFFYIGGHSLLAALLQSKIQDLFKVEFKLEEIFAYPSVAEQAKLINERQLKCTLAPSQFETLPRPDNLPLSYSQQRLWYLQYAEAETPISNIPIMIRIHGKLNLRALTQAFKSIIQRHEILRTTYHSANFQIVQVVQETFDFTINSLACLPADLSRLLALEANKKFDLTKDLMIRAAFYDLSEGQSVLMITQHHIASDAWSLNILMRELSTYYHAFHRGLLAPQLPLPLQYADFSCWQRLHLKDDVLRRELEFWQKQLENVPETIRLPYDKLRSEHQSYQGEFYRWNLPTSLVAELRELGNRNHSTLFMVLLTGFNL
ncbi:MAG: amino acid adenylation domain-containing protein [Tatlockia sp.]|nr:amino acid adenylation domain-containing protein [Tatlockia sp.]